MSLRMILPKPTQPIFDKKDEVPSKISTALVAKQAIPPYGNRKNWILSLQEHFGDGGAFPEIQIVQYPLGMGKKDNATSNAIPVQLNAEGKIKYDVLVRQSRNEKKIVYSKFTDLLPSEVTEDDSDLQKPSEEEVEKITENTRLALEKLTQNKIKAAMPVRSADKAGPAQYLCYTPAQQGVAFNSGAKQRVIRMVEAQRDPMEPARFQTNKKIPRGPPSPPAPVMHSPPRKVTAKEQKEWKIPPCISNWKNPKGYVIPLDKRLAADARGFQQTQINEKFAQFAEALYIADRKNRECVEMRAQLEKSIAVKEKERKEENLRQLATKAREERAGIYSKVEEKDEEVKERDKLRHERHVDRQRDRNLQRAAPERRSKLTRQRERDISEMIALGVPNPMHSQEMQYDERLFNQSKGIDSGFGDEDGYNVYDKAWRSGQAVRQSVYRPSKKIDEGDDLEKLVKARRFVPDKKFSGTHLTACRDGPVQFEKQQDKDPFGLDKFLTEAKRANKRSDDQRDKGHSSRDYGHSDKIRKLR